MTRLHPIFQQILEKIKETTLRWDKLNIIIRESYDKFKNNEDFTDKEIDLLKTQLQLHFE